MDLLTGRRAVGEASLDSKLVYEKLLKKTQVGDVTTYDSMSALLGRDIRSVRGSMETARRMALRHDGFVFFAIPNVGLKRLSNSEIAELPKNTQAHIRRCVGREIKRQTVVNVEQLTNAERIAWHTRLSVMGVLNEFTRVTVTNKVKALNPAETMPVGKVLELFR